MSEQLKEVMSQVRCLDDRAEIGRHVVHMVAFAVELLIYIVDMDMSHLRWLSRSGRDRTPCKNTVAL